MSKSSPLWNYFNEIAEEKAQCKKCPTKVSRKGGSTKSMWDHLKGRHNDIYVSLKSSNPDEKQGLISTFLTPEKDEQQKADELVA